MKQVTGCGQRAEAGWQVLTEQELVGTCIGQADGTVAFVNHAAAGLLGCKPEEMIGRPLLDFVPSAARDQMAVHFRPRTTEAGAIVQGTATLVRHDGSITNLLIRSGPVAYLDEQAWLLCMFDITHLRQAEPDLQFARRAVEDSPVIAFQALAQQPGFPCLYVSQNVIRFGYTAEEVKRGSFRFPDFVHPDDRPGAVSALDAIAAGRNDVVEQDYRIIARAGAVHWVHDCTVGVRDAAGTLIAYRRTLTDVTQRVLSERRLARTNRALRALSAANGVLVHATSEAELLRDMCRVLVETGGYASAWISFAEQDDERNLTKVAIHGDHHDLIERLPLSWGDNPSGLTPTGTAVRTGQPQVNANFATNPVMTPWRDEWQRRGCGSSAALPLKDAQGTFGAVSLVARDTDAFDQEEMDLLEEMARHFSFGIGALRMRMEHDRLQQRLQRSMNDTVQALAGTLEVRDPYTAGHQRNVTWLAAEIGAAMGVPAHELEGIRLTAALHDIGKIRIPLEISGRPGKLSPLEMRLMQTHVDSGYEILKGIDFPWPVADMVRQHHERLDGSGYPLGLHDDQILLGAKIVAVADVADSMLAHRPYRPSLGIAATMAELRRGRGQLYHPAAVDACLAVLGRTRAGARADGAAAAALPDAGPVTGGLAKPPPSLTMQQWAVMQLLAQGVSIAEIARTMDIAPATVKIHLEHACAALGAGNAAEAIMCAGFQAAATPTSG